MERIDAAAARDHIEMVDRILAESHQRLCSGGEHFVVWGIGSAYVPVIFALVNAGVAPPAALWSVPIVLGACAVFSILRGRLTRSMLQRSSLVQREFFNVLWLTLGLAFVGQRSGLSHLYRRGSGRHLERRGSDRLALHRHARQSPRADRRRPHRRFAHHCKLRSVRHCPVRFELRHARRLCRIRRERATRSRLRTSPVDELLLSKVRLGVVAELLGFDWVAFSELVRALNVSNGNLGAHLSKLVEAGYVDEEKSFVNRRPLTRYRLTKRGREAFATHVSQLQSLLKEAK